MGRIRFADLTLKPRLAEHPDRRSVFFFLHVAIRNSLRSNNTLVPHSHPISTTLFVVELRRSADVLFWRIQQYDVEDHTDTENKNPFNHMYIFVCHLHGTKTSISNYLFVNAPEIRAFGGTAP